MSAIVRVSKLFGICTCCIQKTNRATFNDFALLVDEDEI
jgi:hypothetical protein